MTERASIVYLSEDGWMRWDEGAPKPVRLPGSPGGGGVFGLPGVSLRTFPLRAATRDPAILRGVLETEAGLRFPGLPLEGLGQALEAYPVTDAEGGGGQVMGVLLQPDAGPDEAGATWRRFEPAVCRFPLPEGAMVLFREGTDWMACFGKGGRPAYVHPVRHLDEGAAAELGNVLRELTDKDFADAPREVVSWSPLHSGEQAALENALGLTVREAERPAPVFETDWESGLIPRRVAEAREEAEGRRRRVLAMGAGVAVIAGLVAAAVGHLAVLEARNRELRDRVTQAAPEAEKIRDARDRWVALEEAIDPTRYPVEIFYRVASLLRKDAVRFTSFAIEGDRLSLVVESRDVPSAIRFRSSLMEHPDLEAYEWVEAPQPEVLEGNRARLSMAARYRYGETETQ